MSNNLLANFMELAKNITQAERALAADTSLQIQEGSDSEVSGREKFEQLARDTMQDAMNTGNVVITNNIFTKPSDGPITNTAFNDLRVGVGIPVPGLGAIFLDQPIKMGVFDRLITDRLKRLAEQISTSEEPPKSTDEMLQMYESMV